VIADNGEFSSSLLAKGATFSFTFDTAGTYGYHCSIHPSMTGTVVVQ
jgi:plastocyanin